jgi:hypothetical protein
MTIDTLIIVFGGLVAALPILQGIPDSVQRPLLFLFGIIIVGLGVVVRRRGLCRPGVHGSVPGTAPAREQHASTFVESAPTVAPHTFDSHEGA